MRSTWNTVFRRGLLAACSLPISWHHLNENLVCKLTLNLIPNKFVFNIEYTFNNIHQTRCKVILNISTSPTWSTHSPFLFHWEPTWIHEAALDPRSLLRWLRETTNDASWPIQIIIGRKIKQKFTHALSFGNGIWWTKIIWIQIEKPKFSILS